eukprot:CAMPEP_0170139334 /NCGR_PEP_ID=MMETSP0033_2-20121228/5577_1 /TAXON_ID=195969 /ORGANISM="Dolichomastix tenuilepis, Strain CCMP3274" /LENGTH=97 /DNA_ID=CAMNT_0010375439 /DNA_START=30 /DNA_END=320 /DNA_ORIENTATION=-
METESDESDEDTAGHFPIAPVQRRTREAIPLGAGMARQAAARLTLAPTQRFELREQRLQTTGWGFMGTGDGERLSSSWGDDSEPATSSSPSSSTRSS